MLPSYRQTGTDPGYCYGEWRLLGPLQVGTWVIEEPAWLLQNSYGDWAAWAVCYASQETSFAVWLTARECCYRLLC